MSPPPNGAVGAPRCTDAPPPPGTCPPPTLPSSTLLRGHSAVLIEHNGQHYRLQATRQGKLILTK
jgi:hemin uptake protein HemP